MKTASMRKPITAALVCAAILPLGSFALGDEPSGTEGASDTEVASGTEGENVWTLSGDYTSWQQGALSKGDWQFKVTWYPADHRSQNKKLLVIHGCTSGEGVLDWDGIVLKTDDGTTISDLGVQIVWNAFSAAPITEFYCDKVASLESWSFRENKTITRIRASGPRLTALGGVWLAGCPKLTTVKLDFPNLRMIGHEAFVGCTNLTADVTDILNPAVTNIGYYAFSKVKELSGELVLTNIQALGDRAFESARLTKIHLAGPLSNMDAAFYACTAITNATFDLAEDVSALSSFWGGPGSPFERIRFLRKPFGAESMTNLLGFVANLTDPKACQIRVSRQQWPLEERQACGWWRPATKEGGLSDEELAARPQGCLGYAEVAPTNWPVKGGKRRAWIVHEPSPYDKAGLIISIR